MRYRLPASVRTLQEKLDPELHEAFAGDYTGRRKSLLIAYLLCLLGWHYLYLGKIGLQFAFLLSVGGLGIWLLVDLIRLPGMVARKNEGIAWDVMSRYGTVVQNMGGLPEFLT